MLREFHGEPERCPLLQRVLGVLIGCELAALYVTDVYFCVLHPRFDDDLLHVPPPPNCSSHYA
jgi:hypothetical protein